MMTPNNVRDWNPNAPLPHGVTLLEASAGTGKTYQIAHLVMRLVAEEGHRIDRLLVMTFTRDATAELRERLLARIAKASSCLAPGAPPATDDPTLYAWVDMMNTTGRAEAARHHLERALREFDRAAIATIHSFCQQVLTRFAFDSDTAHDLEAIADLSPVIRDFVVDFVTRTGFSADDATWRQLAPKGAPELKPWIRLAELALLDPDAATDPLPDGTSLFDPIYLEQLARAFRPAAAFFAKHRDALVGWLDAAYADGRLKINNRKTKYKADNNRAHADTLGAWLDDPTNTPTPTDTPFKHFDPATIRGDADNPDLDVPADFARFMQLLASARAAIDSPSAAVELPIRQRFVAELRARWPELMRARGQVAFQDLLERLAAAVSDPRPDGPGPRLRRAMADAWPVVLLDEFQDTDRVQWAIFERAFADRPDGRLLLIGDPKQAIYGFRGANIHVYFRAAQCAGPNRYTLTTNYRSDPGLMQAFNRMFGQPAFFDIADLAYHPNDAAAPAARLIPGDSLFHDGPFHLRCMRPADGKTMPAGDILKVLPNLVAADIAELLAAGARLVEPTPGTSANDRPIAPSDIAVLVSSHRQAAAIAEALAARDIASVRASSGSVLDTEAFDALLHWLAVLRDPADEGARRLLALTPLFAWSPVDLARLRAASDNDATNPGDPAEAARDAALRDRWAILSRQVVRWREVFDRSGILAAWARTADDADIDGRLLRREDGDRWLTDLRHLIELLHIAQTAERRGLPGLWQWLARQRDQQDTDAHRRRLERDDAAVRIVTTHASKGLEYPIVFAPFVWSAREPKAPLLATHPADPSRRALCLDLSPGAPAVARTDDRQERQRLL
jgi:exodeoxyribonuclease V beta subunit